MSAPWVLVTDDGDGQSRTALVAARALSAGGYSVAATVSARWSLVGRSRCVARKIPLVAVSDPDFAEQLAEAQRTTSYVATIPTSDFVVDLLKSPSKELLDKKELAARARAVGLDSPDTITFASHRDLIDGGAELMYPAVIKPARSTARPVLVRSERDLTEVQGLDGDLLVQRYLPGPMRAVAGVVWQGGFAAVTHQGYLRTWPVEIGGACAAVTTEPDRALEERLLDLLGEHEGVFMAQLIGNHLLDLNPRVYGSLPLSVAAGANLPAIYCDLLRGGTTSKPVRAGPGVRFRWLEGDIRHMVRRLQRKEIGLRAAGRALLPRRKTAHAVESLKDPLPMVARLAFAASNKRS